MAIPADTQAAMMAPVLVPQAKSKKSASTSFGSLRAARRSASSLARISTLISPRMPPPSQARIFFGPGAAMRAARGWVMGAPLLVGIHEI